MKILIETIAYGGWYPRGAERMAKAFDEVSPGYELKAWIDELPPGSPKPPVLGGEYLGSPAASYDYAGYCAKPFALQHALNEGADIAILLDAAFYPIRDILPLIQWIDETGYYFCKNGASVGQWSSDRALHNFALSREQAFRIEEISSYCVGVDLNDLRCRELIALWCERARDLTTFPGPHTNVAAERQAAAIAAKAGGRNPGFCSPDSRVSGHRHDQTALSIIAHQLFMRTLVPRPRFTTYAGHETEETVLVNQGGL